MTLTTPQLPCCGNHAGRGPKLRCASVPGIRDAEVVLVWEPAWGPHKDERRGTARTGDAVIDAPALTIGLADYCEPSRCRSGRGLARCLCPRPDGRGRTPARRRESAACRRSGGARRKRFSLIARLDEDAVGLANCFMAYSTFAAEPIVNIHDFAVLSGHRGRGIGPRPACCCRGRGLEQGRMQGHIGSAERQCTGPAALCRQWLMAITKNSIPPQGKRCSGRRG